MVGRFDGCCPYCGKAQDVYACLSGSNYRNEFYFECRECEKRIVVDVTMEPVFELNTEESVKKKDRWLYNLPKLEE